MTMIIAICRSESHPYIKTNGYSMTFLHICLMPRKSGERVETYGCIYEKQLGRFPISIGAIAGFLWTISSIHENSKAPDAKPPKIFKKISSIHWMILRQSWITFQQSNYQVVELFADNVHPRKLTWNPKMEVRKMILLFKGVKIFRFYVNFRGGYPLDPRYLWLGFSSCL